MGYNIGYILPDEAIHRLCELVDEIPNTCGDSTRWSRIVSVRTTEC